MNVYAFMDDYIFYYCLLKQYTKDYIFPTELIHLIMIYYIDSFKHLLVSGDYHTFYYHDQILTSFGWNEYNQICVDKSIKKTPYISRTLPNLNLIACGSLYSVFVSESVYGFGNNYLGQIGRYVNLTVVIPEKIKVVGKVLAVSCGSYHTIIVTDKHVYGLGCNRHGQLSKQIENYYIPTIIDINNIVNVVCAGFHSFLMTDKGDVYALGANQYGQLGLTHRHDINEPEKINLSHVIAISSGLCHSMFLCKNGDLYGCGSNIYGQSLANNLLKIMSNVIMVKCGEFFTVVLVKEEKEVLYSFGRNNFGQLGVDCIEDCFTPQKINLDNILSFSCGKNFTIVNTKNGLYGFGADGKCQLGQCKK